MEEIKAFVDSQYENGRVTVMTDAELLAEIDAVCAREHIELL